MSTPVTYRFSFGPWNISEGGDPFGGDVRKVFPHEEKFALYRPLGFEGVQFHDDDVVPGMDDLKPDQIQKKATEVKVAGAPTPEAAACVAKAVEGAPWAEPLTCVVKLDLKAASK